jgi:hypothetical protein
MGRLLIDNRTTIAPVDTVIGQIDTSVKFSYQVPLFAIIFIALDLPNPVN